MIRVNGEENVVDRVAIVSRDDPYGNNWLRRIFLGMAPK